MNLKYNIGDKVWIASWDSSQYWTKCMECGGTDQFTVILWNDTKHSVACDACSQPGWDQPKGFVRAYNNKPKVEQLTITGFEVNRDKIEYKLGSGYNSFYIKKEDELFDTEAKALEEASRLTQMVNEKEQQRTQLKEKPSRTWSYHVGYHRNRIRQLERDLEYHKAALNVAKIKAKELSDV